MHMHTKLPVTCMAVAVKLPRLEDAACYTTLNVYQLRTIVCCATCTKAQLGLPKR